METCNCGCGLKPTTKTGWVMGHWNKGRPSHWKGQTKETNLTIASWSEKISQSMKEKYISGELKSWNKIDYIPATCLCGCGREVKRTRKWARGHHSRINNISKRDDIRQIRSQKLKERFANGQMPDSWNKGLTIEDERVKRNVELANQARDTPEYKHQMSVHMQKLWADGILKPMKGIESSRWKGGISSVAAVVQSQLDLYKLWKRPILKRDNFECRDCIVGTELNVHHDQEEMHEIIAKFIPKDKHELSYEEKKKIAADIIIYHVENNVSGITLCKMCHKKRHKSYNF